MWISVLAIECLCHRKYQFSHVSLSNLWIYFFLLNSIYLYLSFWKYLIGNNFVCLVVNKTAGQPSYNNCNCVAGDFNATGSGVTRYKIVEKSDQLLKLIWSDRKRKMGHQVCTLQNDCIFYIIHQGMKKNLLHLLNIACLQLYIYMYICLGIFLNFETAL